MIPTSGDTQLHDGNVCKIAALSNSTKSVMPTSGISKFLYDFLCQYRALDNSTIISYQSDLH